MLSKWFVTYLKIPIEPQFYMIATLRKPLPRLNPEIVQIKLLQTEVPYKPLQALLRICFVKMLSKWFSQNTSWGPMWHNCNIQKSIVIWPNTKMIQIKLLQTEGPYKPLQTVTGLTQKKGRSNENTLLTLRDHWTWRQNERVSKWDATLRVKWPLFQLIVVSTWSIILTRFTAGAWFWGTSLAVSNQCQVPWGLFESPQKCT